MGIMGEQRSRSERGQWGWPTLGPGDAVFQWKGQVCVGHGACELLPRAPLLLAHAGLARGAEGGIGVALRYLDPGVQGLAILAGPGDVEAVIVGQVCDQAGQLG